MAKLFTELVVYCGGDDVLAQRIFVRCFSTKPSIGSRRKVLHKTPWAREKMESVYRFMLRDLRSTIPTCEAE